jgi:N-acetylglucosamine kinase-like BadF-type ATPase
VTAAQQGDSAAHHIIETAAQNLAATALALIGKHPWFASCDLVLTGSIFTHSEAFNLTFREAIRVKYPEIMFHNAAHTPAYGAALLALKHHSEQLYLKESD